MQDHQSQEISPEPIVEQSVEAPSTFVKLSPEVVLENEAVYLIRLDNSETRKGKETGELCLVIREEVAECMVDSIANEEMRTLYTPSVKVYRENVDDPKPYRKRIDIYTQQLGLFYDGSQKKVASIGYVAVPFAQYISPLPAYE